MSRPQWRSIARPAYHHIFQSNHTVHRLTAPTAVDLQRQELNWGSRGFFRLVWQYQDCPGRSFCSPPVFRTQQVRTVAEIDRR